MKEKDIRKRFYCTRIMGLATIMEFMGITLILLKEAFTLVLEYPKRVATFISNGVYDGICDGTWSYDEMAINSDIDNFRSYFNIILLVIAIIFIVYIFLAIKNNRMLESNSKKLFIILKIEQGILIIIMFIPVIFYFLG